MNEINDTIGCVNHDCDKCKAVQEPVAWPTLTADEREALERFHETWEDDQGYDVPKPMMKRLAKLGVVYGEGFGRYGMTAFGLAALQSTPRAAQPAPVQGVEIGWMDADDLATWIEHGGNFCHVYSMSAEPHHRRADKKVILYTTPPAAPEKGQP
jgi:hypothetical protein